MAKTPTVKKPEGLADELSLAEYKVGTYSFDLARFVKRLSDHQGGIEGASFTRDEIEQLVLFASSALEWDVPAIQSKLRELRREALEALEALYEPDRGRRYWALAEGWHLEAGDRIEETNARVVARSLDAVDDETLDGIDLDA
jgi:hypothetical protein